MTSPAEPVAGPPLGELRRLLDAASPAPWRAEDCGPCDGWQVSCPEAGHPDFGRVVDDGAISEPDAEFVAAIRNAAPALLSAAERLPAVEAALAELVALKRISDRYDEAIRRCGGVLVSTIHADLMAEHKDYLRRKPTAWSAAFALIDGDPAP